MRIHCVRSVAAVLFAVRAAGSIMLLMWRGPRTAVASSSVNTNQTAGHVGEILSMIDCGHLRTHGRPRFRMTNGTNGTRSRHLRTSAIIAALYH